MGKFPYDIMLERPDALERLDLKLHWGYYEIRVLRFHLTSFEPGKMIAFHKHAEYEFHFIPSGKGKVIFGSKEKESSEYYLQEGSFYLTGPEVMHYQEAAADEAMYELCLHVEIIDRSESLNKIELLDQWEIAEAKDCINKLKTVPHHPVTDLYLAMPYFLEAYKASTENTLGALTLIKQCIIQILLRSVRAYDMDKATVQLPSRDMKAYRYQLALQYIQANYTSSLTLEDVSEKLNISSRQLQRIFKEMHTEGTFSSIVEDIRIQAVCLRLIESQLPIDQIATLEGFSNGNYLHAVFQKKFYMTPTAYRKTNQIERKI